MAQLSMPPIPTKMYRHFAVLTVLFTLFIAMFADGEGKEVREMRANPNPSLHSNEEQRGNGNAPIGAAQGSISRGSFGEASLVRRNASRGTFSDDAEFDHNFGEATDQTSQNGRNTSYNPFAAVPRQAYSQEYLDSLSEEEREALLEQLRTENAVSQEERRQQASALQQASRRRAGAAGGY